MNGILIRNVSGTNKKIVPNIKCVRIIADYEDTLVGHLNAWFLNHIGCVLYDLQYVKNNNYGAKWLITYSNSEEDVE